MQKKAALMRRFWSGCLAITLANRIFLLALQELRG